MNDVTTLYRQLDTVVNPKEKNPLVRFREVVKMEERCFGIITEHCAEGNLERHLLGRKDIQQILIQMKQIAQGVEWLHRRGVTHADLKPANILLKDGQFIISDVLPPSFRFCVRLRGTEGTYDYFPPEHFSGVLQPASDIWSLGLIFLEMIHGRRIRQLQDLNEITKPSMMDNYPSPVLIAAVTHPDLQALIASMIRLPPYERADIAEVVARLEEMSGLHLQTKRNVALRQQVEYDGERSHALPLALTINHSTPYIRHFTVTTGKVTRIDEEKIRVQAVSREKIPLGMWAISVVVVSYGTWNDEVAVGFTTEERRYERMSGDIDQGGCMAYWSNFANAKANLCLNGEWNDTPLPYLREGKSVLKMVVNTEDRNIHWFVDSLWVRETPMPRNFWDQSLYFFVGLMGKNCSVQILQPEMHL